MLRASRAERRPIPVEDPADSAYVRSVSRAGALVLLAALSLTACMEPSGAPDDARPEGDAAADRDAAGAGSDAGVEGDAEPPEDAAEADAEPDAGAADAEPADAEQPDADAPDTAPADGGLPAAHWANTQWPPYLTRAPGESATAYGQIWIEGLTDSPGPAAGVEAELGLGSIGSDPAGGGWTWVPAAYNVDVGNNDEYQADLIAPPSGLFDYAFRFRLNGSPWILADRSDGGRTGSNDGYRSEDAGKLAVRTSGAVVRIATLNLHCINDDPLARLDAAAARFAQLGTELIALQEVCAGAPLTGSAAEYLAQQLESLTGQPWHHLYEQTHLANGVTPEGIGVVTNLAIADVTVHDLPIADFPRKTIIAVTASPLGMIAFATAHLSYRLQDGQARLDQANELATLMDQLAPTEPAVSIVAGDFNSTPDEPPPGAMIAASFSDAFATVHPGLNGYTYSSAAPTRRIDYVFTRAAQRWPLELTTVDVEFDQPYRPGGFVSDHRGISATLAAP